MMLATAMIPCTDTRTSATRQNQWLSNAAMAYGLIAFVTLFRLVYIFRWCPYDLAPDEAHYWDWSRHLDWSYYSKGPLVAWLIRGSVEIFGAISVPGAIRVPAVICGGLFLLGLFQLARLTLASDRVAFIAVVLASSFPAVNAFSLIMTIDAPYLTCWVWATVCGINAITNNRRRDWIATGGVVAIGILAKYTMAVWLPSFAFFLWSDRTRRSMLRSVNVVWLIATASLSAVPILYWNSQHDWVTFRHVAGQAGVTPQQTGIRWLGPFVFLGGQLAILLVYWFISGVWVCWKQRPGHEQSLGHSYLWWMSVPTLALFTIVSLKAPIQLNWPAAGYIGGLLLVVDFHYRTWHNLPKFLKLTCCSVIGLGLFGTAIIHDSRLLTRVVDPLLPPDSVEKPLRIRQFDPAARLKGWHYLGEQLDMIRREVKQVTQAEPIVAGVRWDLPGEIAVYSQDTPPVYTLGLVMGDRHSQYDWWRPNPIADAQVFQGKTFIFVGVPGVEHALQKAFDTVEQPRVVTYREGNRNAAQWYVWVCHGYHGFDTQNAWETSSRH